jgi:uncharacterized protein
MSGAPPVTPVPPSQRLASLDVLRGAALLGILVINIQSFAMIEAAYLNPTAYGDLAGVNRWVWILSHVLGDMKFMTLFSVLFGAGIVLITTRAGAKGRGAATLHYRRTFWLLLFGLTHAYLLWYGDILVAYALCAVPAFLVQRVRPTRLLAAGVLLISVPSGLYLLFGGVMQVSPQAVADSMSSWRPGAEKVAAEVAAYRGGWLEQMACRIPSALVMQTFVYLIMIGWRAGGLMLIGMALFKWGVLSGQRSPRFYLRGLVLGYGLGFPIVVAGVVSNFRAGWALEYSMFLGWQFNYWGSLLVALGHLSAVILLVKANLVPRLANRLAAVGRMALTNYLLQTVICTTLFYGHGLGLFGQVERWGQALVVLGVWLVQLALSPVWLRHLRFGPAEWLWRSLTYMKWQQMGVEPSREGPG